MLVGIPVLHDDVPWDASLVLQLSAQSGQLLQEDLLSVRGTLGLDKVHDLELGLDVQIAPVLNISLKNFIHTLALLNLQKEADIVLLETRGQVGLHDL